MQDQPEKHTVATSRLQRSIALLLGELNKDWCELVLPSDPEPSVGIPD